MTAGTPGTGDTPDVHVSSVRGPGGERPSGRGLLSEHTIIADGCAVSTDCYSVISTVIPRWLTYAAHAMSPVV